MARSLHDDELRSLDALVNFLGVVGVDDQVAIGARDERGDFYLVKTLESISLPDRRAVAPPIPGRLPIAR